MKDRHISVTVAASSVLWAIGFGLMVAGAFGDLRFMGWGLWLSGIGGVFTVRRMFCHREHDSRNAFELGRDYERSNATIRSLR